MLYILSLYNTSKREVVRHFDTSKREAVRQWRFNSRSYYKSWPSNINEGVILYLVIIEFVGVNESPNYLQKTGAAGLVLRTS